MIDIQKRELEKLHKTLKEALEIVESLLNKSNKGSNIFEHLDKYGFATTRDIMKLMKLRHRQQAIRLMEKLVAEYSHLEIVKQRSFPYSLVLINKQHKRYKALSTAERKREELLDKKQQIIDFYIKHEGKEFEFSKVCKMLGIKSSKEIYELHKEFRKECSLFGIKRVNMALLPVENIRNVYIYRETEG